MKPLIASMSILVAFMFFPWYIVLLTFMTGAWYGELTYILIGLGFLYDVVYSPTTGMYAYLYTLISFCIALGVYYIRTRVRI